MERHTPGFCCGPERRRLSDGPIFTVAVEIVGKKRPRLPTAGGFSILNHKKAASLIRGPRLNQEATTNGMMTRAIVKDNLYQLVPRGIMLGGGIRLNT